MFSVQLTKLFKSSTFRLALIYVALFSVSVLLLLGFIYWSTAGYMVRQTEATIEAEITGLAESYDQSGLLGLSKIISERLSQEKTNPSLYLLTDAQFKPILGNLEKWPDNQPSEQGWLSFYVDSGARHSAEQHKALARIFTLQGKFHLLVGRDVHNLEEIQSLIREALFWGLMITIVLALGGGTMMSRTMMHKIEMINDTCHRIMEGDLTQRIPRSGGDDDFDKLIGTLNRMLAQLENLMQGVKQVTNNIAHDLRTPLSRLRRRLDMLRVNGQETDQHEELLDQAINEADGLLTTFKALLRISEVESGSRRGGFEDVDITALLDDLIELYKPLSEDKGQTIVLEKQRIQSLQGDRDLLFQAFANVLDNAIKYTPASGHIQLIVKDQPSQLQVSICDTGPGIPAEARDKVFERFYRLEASRSPPGNGLGLSLVAAIVNLHYGQLELSDNCPGLKLTITLPRSL
ncbi:MAG: HAMP domain-containing histidine kinase [Desulfuromusa sp.]|nr:HAMP domain-containing histidine kinase [Desulfuromusa sp.]